MLKNLRRLTLMTAAIALPLAANAQVPAPQPQTPAPGPANTELAGCYQVSSGLPDGFAMSFCLNPDHDGYVRLIAGAGQAECERRLDWSEEGHIDWRLIEECGEASQQLSNDATCVLYADGLNCVFGSELGQPERQFIARKVI